MALLLNAKLTTSQYKELIKEAKEIYPSYDRVLNAKKECYPDNIIIIETMGEVKLQSLLDHSVQRLIKAQKEVMNRILSENDVIIHHKIQVGL